MSLSSINNSFSHNEQMYELSASSGTSVTDGQMISLRKELQKTLSVSLIEDYQKECSVPEQPWWKSQCHHESHRKDQEWKAYLQENAWESVFKEVRGFARFPQGNAGVGGKSISSVLEEAARVANLSTTIKQSSIPDQSCWMKVSKQEMKKNIQT